MDDIRGRRLARGAQPIVLRANWSVTCATCGMRRDFAHERRQDVLEAARADHDRRHREFDIQAVDYHDHPLFRGEKPLARAEEEMTEYEEKPIPDPAPPQPNEPTPPAPPAVELRP